MRNQLLSLTDIEAIREELRKKLDESPYNQKTLARQLKKKYPYANWTEKTVNNLFSISKNISIDRINQILSIIDPFEPAITSLDKIISQPNNFIQDAILLKNVNDDAFKDARLTESEAGKLKAHISGIRHDLNKYEEIIDNSVNMELA